MPARQWIGLTGFMGALSQAHRNGNGSGRKKALLIGINYNHDPLSPQRDMKKMRALLKENFGYRDEDIISLTDDEREIAD